MIDDIEQGQPVRVHKNLNSGNWTVRIKIKGKGWRKAGGVDQCHIYDASPVTSEKGQSRIIAKGQREVIACIDGLWGGDWIESAGDSDAIHYNPFRRADFHYENNATFEGCRLAQFHKQAPVFNAHK